MKTKSLTLVLGALTFLAMNASTFASELTVTCGKNAYEALDEKDVSLAEFSAVLELKGKNNPAQLTSLSDGGEDLTSDAEIAEYDLEDGAYSIAITIPGGKYEISVKGCADIDESEGKVTQQQRMRPGSIMSWKNVGSANCNCVKN